MPRRNSHNRGGQSRRRYQAKAKGFRSGLEDSVQTDLKAKGEDGEYERHKVTYVIPESSHVYTPDFKLKNGIFIETKGYFSPDDRKKHLHIRASNPDLDIRFVFQNANTKIRKGSKTSYADWCDKNGFLWTNTTVPQEWIDE